MTSQPIPFNQPSLTGNELRYIEDAIKRQQLSGDGFYTEQCQSWINDYVGCPKSLLTHSATAALEMAAILTGIGPGDEVIMPSFTFVSTANAVVLRGGLPVFVDIRQDTLNLDESLVEAAITERTRAIFAVHYAGVCAEMNKLRQIADDYGLWLVEDAAQALGSYYDGSAAGSLGHLAAISFHETKNITCGEGGAILINDATLSERAEIIREKGTDRKRFFRGEVEKYSWVDAGSSYLPGELNAAFLFGQLENIGKITQKRLSTWARYFDALDFEKNGVCRPKIPQNCKHNGHLFYLLLPTPEKRTAFIAHMKNEDIMTPFHYVPLHNAPAGKRFARTHGPMTNTNTLSAQLVRLPIFYDIGHNVEKVIDASYKFLQKL